MKEKKYERKIYNLDKELKDEKEIKKNLHEIYFSNLEENLHLLLNNQKTFFNELLEKINYCLKLQYSPRFFEVEESISINNDFKANFLNIIYRPLEKFIEEETSNQKKKKYDYYKGNKIYL